MADFNECEGNIISPLGIFKKLPTTSPAAAVHPPVCVPTPSMALKTSTVTTSTVTSITASSTTVSVPIPSKKKAPMLAWREALVAKDKANTICIKELMSMVEAREIIIAKLKLEIADSNKRFPADHEPNFCPEICETVVNTDVKADDHCDGNFDHQNNIVSAADHIDKELRGALQEKDKQLPVLCSTLPALVTTSDMATQADSDTTTTVASSELQKARATIATQAKQMVGKEREIKRLTSKVATLTHYNNQAHLALQQNMSVHSSITGSVFDSSMSDVDPEEGVTPDPVPVLPPHAEAPRRDDSNQISQMLDSVDRLAQVYSPADRYHKPSSTNLHKPRNDVEPDKLMNFVFAALWLNANDATEEEEAEYDHHLERELRPPPIFSPSLRKPWVNWNKLNPFQFKNLPQPIPFPLQSCSPDPQFYLEKEHKSNPYNHSLKWNMDGNKYPFGHLYGFDTNMGIVSVPEQVIHGYRCNSYSGGWVIDAMG